MEDLFVPYELALELKKLGFNEESFGYYNMINHSGKFKFDTRIWEISDNYIEAPLYQQAFDWLLEKHHLYSVIIPTITMCWTFKTMTAVEGIVEVPPYKHVDAYDYPTYKEARLECLKKLIYIIQENGKKVE